MADAKSSSLLSLGCCIAQCNCLDNYQGRSILTKALETPHQKHDGAATIGLNGLAESAHGVEANVRQAAIRRHASTGPLGRFPWPNMATGAASVELSRLLRRRLALVPRKLDTTAHEESIFSTAPFETRSGRSPASSPLLDPISLPAWI